MHRRLPSILGLLLLAGAAAPGIAQDTSAAPVRRASATGELRLTYLGNAGWEITDGVTVVLVDPYLTQFARWDPKRPVVERGANPLISPDTALVNAHVTRADYILITHGHTDHALDAGYIARRTGATIIGHETAANLARAYDVPEAKLITVIGGEDYEFGAFSLRVIPNIHSALDQKHYYNNGRGITGNAPRGLRAPLHVKDYVEGGNMAYLLRMAGHEVVIMGSMNYIEREMTGLRPDIALVGANDQRREIYDYTGRLLRALGLPALVIPTHADNYGNPNPPAASVASSQRFLAEVAAASPKSRVIVPKWFEPIVVPAATSAVEYPRYDRALLLETTSETSANASFGDLDGDGNLDIVLAKGRHWPLVDRVLLGDGKGGIRQSFDLGVASDKSYSGRLVDLDGDGDLDVVISNDAPSPKLVYLNDGTGHFAVGSTYGSPDWPMRNATVADMNGDGRPDIIAANRTGRAAGFNYICLNRGRGRFDADCIAFSPEPATTITAADFNGDGVMDLLVPHRNGGQSRLYFGARNADLARLRSVPFGPADARIRVAEAADFNGDGVLDVVAIDEGTGIAMYAGTGDGTFAAPVPIGDRTIIPYALTVGDLDCDGAADFVVGNVTAPSTVYFNDGSGRRFTPVMFGDSQGTAYGIAVGDFDKDGRRDIAVARSEAPNVLYFASGPVGRCK